MLTGRRGRVSKVTPSNSGARTGAWSSSSPARAKATRPPELPLRRLLQPMSLATTDSQGGSAGVLPARAPRTRRRLATRLTIALGVSVASVILLAAGRGQENGVVGGECASGLTECSLACVNLQIDNQNCGACGHVCPPAQPCAGGVCGGPANADATTDGSGDGSQGFDSADLDGSGQYCDVF